MKKFKPESGDFTAGIWRSPAFRIEKMYQGYSVQGLATAASNANVKVFEASAGITEKKPDPEKPGEWKEADSGTLSSTESYLYQRADFRAEYIFVEIDISGGSATNPTILINAR